MYFLFFCNQIKLIVSYVFSELKTAAKRTLIEKGSKIIKPAATFIKSSKIFTEVNDVFQNGKTKAKNLGKRMGKSISRQIAKRWPKLAAKTTAKKLGKKAASKVGFGVLDLGLSIWEISNAVDKVRVH